MMDYVRGKTHVNDDVLILQALNAAHSWAYNIVYSSVNGPDLITTIIEEVTPGGVTNAIDFSAFVTYDVAGFKAIWAKLPGETNYTPCIQLDQNDPLFQSNDNIGNVGVSTPITASHPMHYYIFNFVEAKFDKVWPADIYFRVDYFRYPPALDPTAHNDLSAGLDLPAPFHQAVTDMAVSEIWDTLDDDRAERRRKLAEIGLNDALYVAAQRTKGPVRTTGFRRPGKRVI